MVGDRKLNRVTKRHIAGVHRVKRLKDVAHAVDTDQTGSACRGKFGAVRHVDHRNADAVVCNRKALACRRVDLVELPRLRLVLDHGAVGRVDDVVDLIHGVIGHGRHAGVDLNTGFPCAAVFQIPAEQLRLTVCILKHTGERYVQLLHCNGTLVINRAVLCRSCTNGASTGIFGRNHAVGADGCNAAVGAAPHNLTVCKIPRQNRCFQRLRLAKEQGNAVIRERNCGGAFRSAPAAALARDAERVELCREVIAPAAFRAFCACLCGQVDLVQRGADGKEQNILFRFPLQRTDGAEVVLLRRCIALADRHNCFRICGCIGGYCRNRQAVNLIVAVICLGKCIVEIAAVIAGKRSGLDRKRADKRQLTAVAVDGVDLAASIHAIERVACLVIGHVKQQRIQRADIACVLGVIGVQHIQIARAGGGNNFAVHIGRRIEIIRACGIRRFDIGCIAAAHGVPDLVAGIVGIKEEHCRFARLFADFHFHTIGGFVHRVVICLDVENVAVGTGQIQRKVICRIGRSRLICAGLCQFHRTAAVIQTNSRHILVVKNIDGHFVVSNCNIVHNRRGVVDHGRKRLRCAAAERSPVHAAVVLHIVLRCQRQVQLQLFALFHASGLPVQRQIDVLTGVKILRIERAKEVAERLLCKDGIRRLVDDLQTAVCHVADGAEFPIINAVAVLAVDGVALGQIFAVVDNRVAAKHAAAAIGAVVGCVLDVQHIVIGIGVAQIRHPGLFATLVVIVVANLKHTRSRP